MKMPVLTDDQRHEVAQLIAERKTHVLIKAYFQEKYGFEIYDSQIMWYKQATKWQTIISEKREAFDKAVSEEYLSSKRNRLIELEAARASAMEGGFAGETKSGTPIYKNSPAAAVAAIKAAQEEMEGKKLQIETGDELSALLSEIAGATRGLPKRHKKSTKQKSKK